MLLCLLKRKKISFLKLAEAASVCALLAIAVGRWGCFMNGCCVGEISDFCLAVHFPNDNIGITRHPVQIYYSFVAFAIVLVLLFVERKFTRYKSHSIIAPLALILYSLMRLVVDNTRVSVPFIYRITHYWNYRLLIYALPLELLWLAYGVYCNKSKLVKS